jgi:hypothetical protein
MAQITIPDLLQGDFAAVEVLQDALDTITNELNGNLDNTNIAADANIDPSKVDGGGAVVEADLTETGEAGKIPKLSDTGDYVITGKLIFQEGSL